jgi:hypothetical protein
MSPAIPADPLVVQLAGRIAGAINDFKRELDKRDGTCASAHGELELVLQSQTFLLTVVPDEHGEEYPVTVGTTFKTHDATNAGAPLPTTAHATSYQPTRRASNVELQGDFVSLKKRKFEENGDVLHKRTRTDTEGGTMPLITKEDLNNLLSKLREDIQENTNECVTPIHRLLRRFKEEWHEKSQHDYEQSQIPHISPRVRDSIPNVTTSDALFPSPSHDRDDQNASVPDIVRREAKLISNQIKWVEDCRRIAANTHDKREETWRTSSAGFHDRQRQDREKFQNRILHESAAHSQTLNHILNEVKAIGLYAQSMKWETPSTHLYPPPTLPSLQPFPTQLVPDQGAGRGSGVVTDKQGSQR